MTPKSTAASVFSSNFIKFPHFQITIVKISASRDCFCLSKCGSVTNGKQPGSHAAEEQPPLHISVPPSPAFQTPQPAVVAAAAQAAGGDGGKPRSARAAAAPVAAHCWAGGGGGGFQARAHHHEQGQTLTPAAAAAAAVVGHSEAVAALNRSKALHWCSLLQWSHLRLFLRQLEQQRAGPALKVQAQNWAVLLLFLLLLLLMLQSLLLRGC
mmetsp:Transcript_7853/g.20939  ORF Transcript_7853/g.20939 Transcript_7853/m.20939 type:complete len:211 (+) Transcript_7853:356-988(+)